MPHKDFATLIAAFAIVTQTRDVRLILLGEGPLHADLLALAESLGVAERVSLPGFQPNPLPFMRRAAVLVVSSAYEGFGNVLVEALACGTPVVSTDCPYGPAEILERGRFGMLVPVGDRKAMAAGHPRDPGQSPAGRILAGSRPHLHGRAGCQPVYPAVRRRAGMTARAAHTVTLTMIGYIKSLVPKELNVEAIAK